MFCPNCGSSAPDEAIFCANCGTKLISAAAISEDADNDIPVSNSSNREETGGELDIYDTGDPSGCVIEVYQYGELGADGYDYTGKYTDTEGGNRYAKCRN